MTPSYVAFSYDEPIRYCDLTISLLRDEDGKITYRQKRTNFDNPDISCNERQVSTNVTEEEAKDIYNHLMNDSRYSIISMTGNALF